MHVGLTVTGRWQLQPIFSLRGVSKYFATVSKHDYGVGGLLHVHAYSCHGCNIATSLALVEDNLSVAGSPRWDREAAGAELYFSRFLDEAKLNRRTG